MKKRRLSKAYSIRNNILFLYYVKSNIKNIFDSIQVFHFLRSPLLFKVISSERFRGGQVVGYSQVTFIRMIVWMKIKRRQQKKEQNWGKKESDEPGKNIIWESGFYFLVHPKLLKESLTLECFWGGLGFRFFLQICCF